MERRVDAVVDRVAAGGLDRQIHLIDVFTGAEQSVIKGHTDFIYGLRFNKKGDKIVSCGYGGYLYVWNAADGKKLFETRLPAVANTVRHSPDGGNLLVACGDGSARVITLPAAAR